LLPDAIERRRLTRKQLVEMTRAPISPAVMARRIQVAMREDFVSDCKRIQAPTLVVTGELGLDRVVPVESTREYWS
jgi:pimeloyl-ACP methyl ester carboxylesterase